MPFFRLKPKFDGTKIAAFVGFCLLLCILGIVILGVNLRNGFQLQVSAKSDNTQWTFSQLDVEYVYLATAIEVALKDPQNLSDLRKRFDIFYNRATILRQGKLFFPLQEDPLYQAGTAHIQAFLQENVASIDGSDLDLSADLPRMKAQMPALQNAVKDVVTSGIKIFADYSDLQRFRISHDLILLATLTAIVVSLLVILSLTLLKLNQLNNDRAAQIQMTLARTETIVTAAIDAVLVIDSHGNAREFNPSAERMFGYTRAEILEKPAEFLFLADQNGQALDLNKAFLNAVATSNRNHWFGVRRDGQEFPLEVSVVAGRDADGSIFVAYLRDLSDELANAQALHQARDDAKATERTKADLLAVMSHEMRTPLNGMLGVIELLDDTKLTPEQSRYLRAIQNSGQILRHHVDDVLKIAKLESGTQAVHLTWVNLPDLVGEIFSTQAATRAANGNLLQFHPAPKMPTLIRSDLFLLRQILTNLISNANKFTQNGVITVTAQPDVVAGGYVLQVIDTGIGIPPENRTRIFEDFVTLDASYTRNTGGTGLGLGIARRIVQTLGGTIEVDVNPSGGSIFKISLPQTAPVRKMDLRSKPTVGTILDTPTLPPKPIGPPLQVLVAEDNEINRMLLREMISKMGHLVSEAHDGREAVTMAKATAYDIIFMDISMPRLDGISASHLIRNTPGPNQATEIVALTAHALAQDRDRIAAAGVQHILIKPFTGSDLVAVIAKLQPRADKPMLLPNITTELRAVLGHDRFVSTLRAFEDEVITLLDSPEPPANEETRQALHKICGAAAMLGAAPFAASLRDLQDSCVARETDKFHRIWPQTVEFWHATQAAIHAELAQSDVSGKSSVAIG